MKFEFLIILVNFIILVASNVGNDANSERNRTLNENIMENNQKAKSKQCIEMTQGDAFSLSARLTQIASRDYLITLTNESLRVLKLEEYLLAKMFKNSEKINSMIIPEMRSVLDVSLIQVLKPRTEHYARKHPNVTVSGPESCSLEKVAFERHTKSPVAICPWRWLVMVRDDRFPFKRANAKCNCVNCQAKTIYDSDVHKLSGCKTESVLMPVLFRETLVEHVEKWTFALEEVPVSCVCSIKLNPL